MANSLLALLLITLFFILVILVVMPAFLKWLAGRNVRLRHRLIRRLRTLDPARELAGRAILPFKESQSTRYRDILNQAQTHLKEVTAIRQQLAEKLISSEFPRIPDEGWPVSHFLANSQHMVTIPNVSVTLWQGDRLLNKAQDRLAQARQELDLLQEMPVSIQQNYDNLLKQRLPALQRQLTSERQAGITSLTDLDTRYQNLVRDTELLANDLTDAVVASPTPNDQLALKLERIESRLETLTDEVNAIRKKRLLCDEKLNVARQAYSDLPMQVQIEDSTPALQLIAEHINTLLQRATAARVQRKFQQANDVTAVAGQLITLTQLLDQMERGLRPLHTHQSDSLQSVAINERYQALKFLIMDVQNTTEAFITEAALPGDAAVTLSGYQEKAQKQQVQITQLQKKLTSDQKQITRQAEKVQKEMETAWRTLQKVISLAEEDQWHQVYLQRQQQFVAAKDKPAPLQQAINDAQALTVELQSLRTTLAEDFEQLRAYLREVPVLEKEAAVQAGDWVCLQAQVNTLREDTAVIQQRGQEALSARQIHTAHEALDEVSTLSQHVQQIFAYLQEQGDRLDQKVDNISYALQIILDESGNVPPQLQNNKNLVDRSYQQALTAVTLDAALDALQQAENLANQMTLR